MAPLWLHVIVAGLFASIRFGGIKCNLVNATSDGSNMLAGTAITASISRRLAYPDFRDDEKAGAITLLGSAEINKLSGTINIPATSKSRRSDANLQNSSVPTGSSSPINDISIEAVSSAGPAMAGRALYSFPFRMMDPVSNTTASFHTTFSFRLHKIAGMGINATAKESNLMDGGLTFLVVPDELTVGRSGGWLGMMNGACDHDYKPFAVEFDMFKNEEFQDPNDHHVGINYGSIISHRTADIADAGISLHNGDTARAWIRYDSSKHLVDVRLAKDGREKPSAPLLAVPLDLSDIFKEYMFVGFSGGTTGNLGHSILSWHFSSDSTGRLRFPSQESCLQSLLPPIQTPSRKAPSAFIIFCLVILVVGLAVLNFVCIPYKRRGTDIPASVKLMRQAREKPRALHKPRKLPISEILEASRLFNNREVLGSGVTGIYYRGILVDSSQVAIKRLSSSYIQQAFSISSDRRKLEMDISRLAQIHHPNIVPLQGWCIEKDEVLLVYEYMHNGSLDQWLFSSASTFPWIRRYKIVKELAAALAFLHSGLEKPIVHRNVKLSNVLLDTTFRAKLGDFGLSNRQNRKVFLEGSPDTKSGVKKKIMCQVDMKGCIYSAYWSSHLSVDRTNTVKGMDHGHNGAAGPPEMAGLGDQQKEIYILKGCMPQAMIMIDSSKRETNQARVRTEEDDVYSYGAVLFEIVSACGEGEGGQTDMVEWVWSLQEEGRVMEAIDEDLRLGTSSRYHSWEEEAVSVLKVGLLCTLHDPSLRPSMELVTKYFNGEIPLPHVPTTRLASSLSCKQQYSGIIYPDAKRHYGNSRSAPTSKSLSSCLPRDFSCATIISTNVVHP